MWLEIAIDLIGSVLDGLFSGNWKERWRLRKERKALEKAKRRGEAPVDGPSAN